ncbi:hypothetical protein CDL12_26702 [Handroanthus impetiginosus]|uniref:Uncharacterized protein n=1 Tax=Handroanthus impetiginosus TaxID=429701 RepID=A0A2G9G661_9LAMI|nr:hypothetical protein CDL12_26702 [Handroanthus impetiginosus]
MGVRNDLYNELINNHALWTGVYGTKKYVKKIMSLVMHWDDTRAPREKWITLSEIELVIATRNSATFLSLTDIFGVEQISSKIHIDYLCDEEHYILVNPAEHNPLPPINQQWNRYKDNSVTYLNNALNDRHGV